MRVLTFTLVTDGTSDRALVPLVEWLLTVKVPEVPFAVRMAEGLPVPSKGLAARIRFAHAMYPSDALIIHRDSEATQWAERVDQIAQAVRDSQVPCWVPVVPVRMTEAWFLFDQRSIRRAAGRSTDTVDLKLPARHRWEVEPDPKKALFAALRTASGLAGRRLGKFDVYAARARVSNLIDDFSYLRGLACFDDFEKRLDDFLGSFDSTAE